MAEKKVGVDQSTVPTDIFNRLQDEMRELQAELETYRQRSPIVGIRWYGEGGFGIGLTHPVNGVSRLALTGYGDKAVIDQATWVRIKTTEHARFGLLVRDDEVIEEMHIIGVAAKKDHEKNVNSYTDKETEELLKGSVTSLNQVLNPMDSHWGPIHFLKAAEQIGMKNVTKLTAIKQRRDKLSCEFRWALLHEHDLRLAADQYKIKDAENTSSDELVKILAGIEIQQNSEFE